MASPFPHRPRQGPLTTTPGGAASSNINRYFDIADHMAAAEASSRQEGCLGAERIRGHTRIVFHIVFWLRRANCTTIVVGEIRVNRIIPLSKHILLLVVAFLRKLLLQRIGPAGLRRYGSIHGRLV